MRELALLDSGMLAGLLVLSLWLPLMMSLAGPSSAEERKARMKYVWVGQGIGALAGLGVLASGGLAVFAGLVGMVGYVAVAILLYRRFKSDLAAA